MMLVHWCLKIGAELADHIDTRTENVVAIMVVGMCVLRSLVVSKL